MIELMTYETAAELLELDARDEKRNRMLLGAVCERICLHLDRNLLLGTQTETHRTFDRVLPLKEFPVREIVEMVDADTGETVPLSPDTPILDIARPDAHKYHVLAIDSPTDRNLRVTYRSGYTPDEIPSLIQAKILEMLRIWIAFSVDSSLREIENTPVNRLDELNAYRKVNRL